MAPFKHPHPFDPTYGYKKDGLLAIGLPGTEPGDFDDFWRNTFRQAETVPLNMTREILPSPSPRYRMEHWFLDVFGGFRVGGWYVQPVSEGPAAMKVVGHGYGGRGGPDLTGAIPAFFPCMPGFGLSARADLPGVAAAHVIHGIQTRDTYLIRFCVAALWASGRAMAQVHPKLAHSLYYEGTSFGGGLGALMLPWDPGYTRAYLTVPTFGHHPLRLGCPCVGSGESVRGYRHDHPEVEGVLAYFDAATAASKIKIPTLCAPALFDPAVPPPGQFAVANALAGPKKIFILSAGHHEDPSLLGEQVELAQEARDWFDPEIKPRS